MEQTDFPSCILSSSHKDKRDHVPPSEPQYMLTAYSIKIVINYPKLRNHESREMLLHVCEIISHAICI